MEVSNNEERTAFYSDICKETAMVTDKVASLITC